MTVLNVQKRASIGRKNAEEIKKQGFLPVVLYGNGIKNQYFQVKVNEFAKIYKEAGSSTILDLNVDGTPASKVLIYDVNLDPVRDFPIHADLFQLNMNEEITVTIPLKFVGKSSAVATKGCILVKSISNLEIKCLPDKLIKDLEVDISKLDNIEDSIRVKELHLPEGVKTTRNLEDIVAIIAEHEEEVVEAVAEPSIKEPELVAKKTKVDGEVAVEGADAKKGEKKEAPKKDAPKEKGKK